MIFVSVAVIIGKFNRNHQPTVTPVSLKPAFSWEKILLALLALILLLGSYSLVMAAGPISGITGGDIA